MINKNDTMIEATSKTYNCKNCTKILIDDNFSVELYSNSRRVITQRLNRNIAISNNRYLRCRSCHAIVGRKVYPSRFEFFLNKIILVTTTIRDFFD